MLQPKITNTSRDESRPAEEDTLSKCFDHCQLIRSLLQQAIADLGHDIPLVTDNERIAFHGFQCGGVGDDGPHDSIVWSQIAPDRNADTFRRDLKSIR